MYRDTGDPYSENGRDVVRRWPKERQLILLKALEKRGAGGGPRLERRDKKLMSVLKHELQTPNPNKRKRSQRNKRAGKHHYWARNKHRYYGNANDTTLAPPGYEAEAEKASTESDASDSSGADDGKSDCGGWEHNRVRGRQPVASSDCARLSVAPSAAVAWLGAEGFAPSARMELAPVQMHDHDWYSQISHGYLMSSDFLRTG